MPSPLTSPAPATETPLWSYASIPSRRKPFDAVEVRQRDRVLGEIDRDGRAVASAAPVGDLVDEAVGERRPERNAGSVEPDLGAAEERHPQAGGERDAVARAPPRSRRWRRCSGRRSRDRDRRRRHCRAARSTPVEGSDARACRRRRRRIVGAAELRRPEDHVALAGVVLAVRIGATGPDDQVVDAVAVDVPRARDRDAAAVVRVDPVEAEAVRCRRAPRDRGSPRSRRRCRRPRSSRRRRTAVRIGAGRPDDQVVDAVAVDVPRARDRDAAVVVRVDPVEAEAVRCRRARRDRGSPRSRRRCRRRRSSRRRRTCRPGSAPGPRRSGRRCRRR